MKTECSLVWTQASPWGQAWKIKVKLDGGTREMIEFRGICNADLLTLIRCGCLVERVEGKPVCKT